MQKNCRHVKLALILCCLSLILGAQPLSAFMYSINLTNGTWSQTINENNLTTAGVAGTNLNSSYTHTLTAIIGDDGIGYFDSNKNWKCTAYKTDSTWHANLSLYIKSNGSATFHSIFNCSTLNNFTTNISSYTQITGSPIQIFYGRCLYDVPLIYQLTGVSVQVPANTYSTTVIYTISAN